MDNLKIEATKYSPEISFDCENNVLEIRGKSYPEDTSVFYSPIFAWVEKYLQREETKKIVVNIELVYFNSSSSKVLLDFFDTLETAANDGKEIAVNWFYEEDDEDALEFGEEFKEDFESLDFNLIEKTS